MEFAIILKSTLQNETWMYTYESITSLCGKQNNLNPQMLASLITLLTAAYSAKYDWVMNNVAALVKRM